MIDPDISPSDEDAPTDGSDAGERRPDQGDANSPGQKPEGPASGGEGAAGAGGPKGFGTGT